MKRGQIKVGAKDSKGNWGQCDVLDLTEESFRVWTCTALIRMGALRVIDGNSPALRNRPAVELEAKKGISFAANKP